MRSLNHLDPHSVPCRLLGSSFQPLGSAETEGGRFNNTENFSQFVTTELFVGVSLFKYSYIVSPNGRGWTNINFRLLIVSGYLSHFLHLGRHIKLALRNSYDLIFQCTCNIHASSQIGFKEQPPFIRLSGGGSALLHFTAAHHKPFNRFQNF